MLVLLRSRGIGLTPILQCFRGKQRRSGLDPAVWRPASGLDGLTWRTRALPRPWHLTPHDDVGLLDIGAAIRDFDPNIHVYVCGLGPLRVPVAAQMAN